MAVAKVERRAERQADEATLYKTYVDSGVLSEVSDTESQIIYGRRGVGKTHLLYFHRQRVSEADPHTLYLIVNCQTLASGLTGISSDPAVAGRMFFEEFLNTLADSLFDNISRLELIQPGRRNAESATLAFVETINQTGNGFDFRNTASTLEKFRNAADLNKIYVALDEFVSIPEAVQPYFAEYLKRLFAANKNVVIKIASVTYQTKLLETIDSRQIGLESGADIFGDINLDVHFIWDENQEAVQLFFLQVLYNHLADLLGWDLSVHRDVKARTIVATFFTQEKCVQELVRASEGNCRDLFNLFKLAYSEFKRDPRPGSSRIGLEHLKSASRQWYRIGKLQNISGKTRDEEFLNFLIQHVIKERKARTFMVHFSNWKHPVLLRLLNLRLLHLLRTTWTHPDRPGEPYYLFTVDYGCYVDLKNTQSEPEADLFFPAGDKTYDDLVPLDDRRSIRRIVLEKADLDRFLV